MKKPTNEDLFNTQCIRCGTSNGLQMIAHRSETGVVGIVFSCKPCEKFVYAGDITITFIEPNPQLQ